MKFKKYRIVSIILAFVLVACLGNNIKAADPTNNGAIDAADLLAVKRHLIGKIRIDL